MVDKKVSANKMTLNEEMKSEKSDQEIARENKMEKLSMEGIELFPHRVKITHSVFDIVSGFSSFSNEELEEKKIEVFVPGRIISIRKMGRAIFFHIADS
ncbi:MAG: lysine--tRNA ligase, partial [Acidobacteriota bacterium]|nr:lysine--tRNA ligase [Acidobacteriota bacterium]